MMTFDITGRHVTVTPPMRQLIERRAARLDRVLNDSAISGQAILSREKYRHRVELLVRARGDKTLRGMGEGTSWPLAVRDAVEKIEQQAKTIKGKRLERKRRSAGDTRVVQATPSVDAAPQTRIIRATRYAVKPMSLEDAALRVESGPEAFLVFRNAESEAISILYRRKDGHLGLIEPD